MMLPEEGYLLRIFIGESDRHDGKLLHEWIVTRAREEGLAGATAIRAIMGSTLLLEHRMIRVAAAEHVGEHVEDFVLVERVE